MYRLKSKVNQLVAAGLLLGALVAPSSAHTVKTAGKVAVTFHIEPNHNPKAGEPARTWFVLTQAGGQQIPFDQCNCQLTVRQAGETPGSADRPGSTLPQPTLKAIAAENYQAIPGADITFAKPGIYQLELRGAAKAGVNFDPFTMSYDVTVQPGSVQSESIQSESVQSGSARSGSARSGSVQSESVQSRQASAPTSNSASSTAAAETVPTGWILGTIGLGGLLIGATIGWMKRNRQKS